MWAENSMARGLWAQATLCFLIPVARMGYTLHLTSYLNCHYGWGGGKQRAIPERAEY